MRTSLFRHSYNGTEILRKSADDVVTVDIIKTCDEVPGTFRDECIKTAKEIYKESAPNKVWIAYSGGIDSEVVVSSFLEADVPFNVITLQLWNNDRTYCYNYHDQEYVSQWCYEHGITPFKVPLNLDHWIQNKVYLDRAVKHQIMTPSNVSMSWLCEQIPPQDTFVMGGEVYVRNCDTHWAFQMRENLDLGLIKYTVLSGRNFVTDFFCYRPEGIVAFLKDPIIYPVWNGKVPGKLSLVSSKQAIYGNWFDIKPRVKYTGYEYAKDYELELYNTIAQNSFPIINETKISFEVNEFLRMLQNENSKSTNSQ